MKVEVRTKGTDDELPLRRLDIRLGGRTIPTPTKAGDTWAPVGQVNELFRTFKEDQLDRMLSDETYERSMNSDIRRKRREVLNLFIVDVPEATDLTPGQLEALSDVQYAHSDVVVTPLWSNLPRQMSGQALLDRNLHLTDAFLDIVETLNDKSVVGSISSRVPRQFLRPIIDRFHERGAVGYVVDLDGRSIMTNPSWMRSLLRIMAEHGTRDETFMYTVNAGEGKFMKNAERVLAKDFVGTGFGIDVLGLNHIRPKLSSQQWAEIKKSRNKNLMRLFDRSDYSYYRLTEQALMDLWHVPETKLYARRKVHNIEEQMVETVELVRRLDEGPSLESYLQTKGQVDAGLIKKMKSLKRATHEGGGSRQDTLF